MLQKSDQQLVEMAKNGEEEALIMLYYRYVDSLLGFFVNKTGDQSDSEDLVSETFIAVIKGLKSFEGRSSFKNWLFGIGKNLLLKFYKNKYKNQSQELSDNLYLESNQVPTEDEENNAIEKLNKILMTLPRKHQQVLKLRFLKGYSISETASALGLGINNVKVLQHRALKKANKLTANL